MVDALNRQAQLIHQDSGEDSGRTKNSVMASSVIGAHTLEHMYVRAFLVLIPEIYTTLGLAPIQAGLLDAVRQLAGGATSMSGGFFVDMFQHRRAHVLAVSMLLIAVGYFLVSIAPTYRLILAALALASAGTALWHPPALGLLAQRFPKQGGLFISLHRSTGNIGAGLALCWLVVCWPWLDGIGSWAVAHRSCCSSRLSSSSCYERSAAPSPRVWTTGPRCARNFPACGSHFGAPACGQSSWCRRSGAWETARC